MRDARITASFDTDRDLVVMDLMGNRTTSPATAGAASAAIGHSPSYIFGPAAFTAKA